MSEKMDVTISLVKELMEKKIKFGMEYETFPNAYIVVVKPQRMSDKDIMFLLEKGFYTNNEGEFVKVFE